MNPYSRILRERIAAYSLLLSLLLTACTETDDLKHVYVDDIYTNSMITYSEDGIITGSLPADKVDKFVKIVTFKQGDVTFTRLVGIEDHRNHSMRAPHFRITKYTDLDSGTTLIHYTNPDPSGENTNYITYGAGEDLEIVSIIDFMPYLYQAGKFQDEYDINDLLAFYHEKVELMLLADEGVPNR